MINREEIDVCMTATIRPSIMKRTMESFCKNMLTDRKRYRLILNIDPIGENIHPKKVLNVAKIFFDNIVCNVSDSPCFCKAVMWCWKNSRTDVVFHLEDDWSLLTTINIDYMIDILEKNKDLVSLRLNKDNTGTSKFGSKYGFIYYPKISLNPTLFLGNFVRDIVPLMEPELNPEKQLRQSEKTERGRYISKIQNGIYVKQGFERIVWDIGRAWMNNSKYSKEIGFTEWKEKNENINIISEPNK